MAAPDDPNGTLQDAATPITGPGESSGLDNQSFRAMFIQPLRALFNRTARRLLLVAALFAIPCALQAQRMKYVTIAIPMRDGKSLAADFYFSDSTVRRPTILLQTPYNKNLYRLANAIPPQAGGTSFPFDSAHYDYVIVDWRGLYGSADAAVTGYDHGLDGYDCVEWIARQAWSDGKIGTWGASALGAVQYMTAKHQPPHLLCAVPIVQDFKSKYDDSYTGGDLRKEQDETIQQLGFTSLSLVMAHPTRDAAWQLIESSTDDPDSITVPMLLIGGWFDHDPDGVMRAFEDLRARSAPAVRSEHLLMMGPWTHSGVDRAEQGDLTYPDAADVSTVAALRFFDHYLRGLPNGVESAPLISYYQMGENVWRNTESWSGVATGLDTLYLASGGGLQRSIEPGSAGDPLPYDPRNPAPSIGGNRFTLDHSVAVGPVDQRSLVESRSDVLIYTTPLLDQDLVVDGSLALDLFFSSDRTDSDVGVRLCDVYPDGRSILLTQSIRRLRFRNGDRPADTARMIPGTVYPVTVNLQNIAMTFPKGHRLRIDVSSSLYPMFDINPNTGGPLYQAGDTLVAANRIYRGGSTPSRLRFASARGSAAVATEGAWGTATLSLDPPAPNPAAGSVRLTVRSSKPQRIVLTMESIVGGRVATVARESVEAGERTYGVDTADLPSGVYLCRLQGEAGVSTQMVTVMR